MRATVTADGWMVWGQRRARAALGEGGIVSEKREGDGATPSGLLPVRRVLYRADRLPMPPRATLPREPIGQQDGWCDDPASPDYNRPVRLAHFSARHERLWRQDGLYDVVCVLGWNDAPVVSGRGSAIFLHVARADYRPTQGCIALALPDLLAALAEGVDVLDVRTG